MLTCVICKQSKGEKNKKVEKQKKTQFIKEKIDLLILSSQHCKKCNVKYQQFLQDSFLLQDYPVFEKLLSKKMAKP